MRYSVTWRAVSTSSIEISEEAIARWAVSALAGRILGRDDSADPSALVELMGKNMNLRKRLASAYLAAHPGLRRESRDAVQRSRGDPRGPR